MKKQESYTVNEALLKMQNFCAYQERCHQEVFQKLQTMNMIPLAIDTIITQLITDNYLNETRFACLFARSKFNQKNWGKNRITLELKRRDISIFNVKKALEEIDEEKYLQKLDAIATQKNSSITEKNSFKKKKKLADYLLYRGWESHLVYEKVNSLIP